MWTLPASTEQSRGLSPNRIVHPFRRRNSTNRPLQILTLPHLLVQTYSKCSVDNLLEADVDGDSWRLSSRTWKLSARFSFFNRSRQVVLYRMSQHG